MSIKKEKAQIKVKQDKYQLLNPYNIYWKDRDIYGGSVSDITDSESAYNALVKKAGQLGNTVPENLKYRNLSQVDDSWLLIDTYISGNARIQGDSKVAMARKDILPTEPRNISGDVVINNSRIYYSGNISAKSSLIEDSVLWRLDVSGNNIVIKNTIMSPIPRGDIIYNNKTHYRKGDRTVQYYTESLYRVYVCLKDCVGIPPIIEDCKGYPLNNYEYWCELREHTNNIRIQGDNIRIKNCVISGWGTVVIGSGVVLDGCTINVPDEGSTLTITGCSKVINSSISVSPGMMITADFKYCKLVPPDTIPPIHSGGSCVIEDKSQIINCQINSGGLRFYNIYAIKSKISGGGASLTEYCYHSLLSLNGANILLKLRNHQVNIITVDNSSNIEIFNTKNLNLSIINSSNIKIYDNVYTFNLSIVDASNHIIKEYAVLEQTKITENVGNIIRENAHLINSTVKGNYDTFRGYSIVNGETSPSSAHNLIWGNAYIKYLNSKYNNIFGSTVGENVSGGYSLIGGNSNISGTPVESIIINSIFGDSGSRSTGENIKVKTSDIIGLSGISDKTIINSELDNKEKVVFNEHDNRLWE